VRLNVGIAIVLDVTGRFALAKGFFRHICCITKGESIGPFGEGVHVGDRIELSGQRRCAS
jgi:hypothetical protein